MSLKILVADDHFFDRKDDEKIMVCRRCAFVLRDVDEIVLQDCIT